MAFHLLRTKWPKLAAFIDDSETDVLAHMDFPAQHRVKIHSTDQLDRALEQGGRAPRRRRRHLPRRGRHRPPRWRVLLEQNDEWQTQHRYMQTELMAELTPALVDSFPPQIATAAE